jgi:WD repeat-containing protein 23
LQATVAWEGKKPQAQTDIARLIRSREATGCWSPSKRTRVSSRVLPQGEPEVVDIGNSRAYIGHFAEDGNCFVAGFQNQTIRLYEVNHTHRPWRLRKEIVARALNWTITDTCLSPNQQLLVYATISPVLHAVNINATDEVRSLQNITDLHTPLDFGEGFSEGAFGLWAINFSHDGKFILAGSSDYATYVYDLAAQKVVSKAKAHKDDVNTVCFLDEGDNVYLSGSDDCYIKVWDRRCGEDGGGSGGINRPQGMLPGHTEGLTYLSPKGDGRYFISNGKDQKCKLWDVRSMSSNSHIKKGRFPKFYWDYRWQPYPGTPNKVKHPNDRSLATFTGHRVLQTLIRCRWSPAETTGQRYIFSGSQCGSLYVYDILTGETSAVFRFHRSVMRDCDWHPYQPLIASVGWDGSVVRWRKMAAEAIMGKMSPSA